MTNASPDDLLQRGIAAARAGQADEARRYFAQAIQANPRSEMAWLWMSSVVQTDDQRIHCLRQVLALNPANEFALKGLRALGALDETAAPPPAEPPPAAAPPEAAGSDMMSMPGEAAPVEAAYEPAYEPEPEPAAPAAEPAPPPAPIAPPPVRKRREAVTLPTPPAPDGIPQISTEVIAFAQREAVEMLRAFDQEQRLGALNIAWSEPDVPRSMRRMLVNPFYLVLGGSVVIVILTIILVSSLMSFIRGRQRPGVAEDLPTATAAATSAATVTPKPTRTPTATGVPFDPGPELPVSGAPRGDLRFGITATPSYIATPHRQIPRLEEAAEAFHAGQYERAVELAQLVREDESDVPVDTYFFEGMSLAYLGRLEDARSIFDQGVQRDNSFAPNHAGLGYIALLQGQPERARQESERAIQLDARFVLPYLTLAQLELTQGNYEAALGTVDTAQEVIGPYDVNLLLMEGQIYLAMGRPEDATAVGNLAYYIDPGAEDAVILVNRGRIELGLYSSAMVDLETLLEERNPSNAEAWALLGRTYDMSNRPDEALEAYARALQLDPRNIDALLARAEYYLNRGDYETALQDYDQAVSLAPSEYAALYGRALAAFGLQDFRQARADLEAIREITPGVPELEVLYIHTLVEGEAYSEAVTAASTALTLPLSDAQQAQILTERGQAYYHLGDMAAARNDLEAALEIEETGTAHYYLGLVYQQQNQLKLALLEMEWVVFWDQFFGYPFGDDAEAALTQLRTARQAELALSYTPTFTPTFTPTATFTPPPTRTPLPTFTPVPTRTPVPTQTPRATVTPRATATP